MFTNMRPRASAPHMGLAVLVLCVLCMLAFNWFMEGTIRSNPRSFPTPQSRIPTTRSNRTINDGDGIDVSTDRMLYSVQREAFVKKFASCSSKRTCHMLYWHVQKTGGTYLASRLYGGMNGATYDSKEWCCHDSFMTKRFRPNPEAYCGRKLGVYEVRPDHFAEVIDTCRSLASTSNRTYLGLISVREPIERTMSAIHQKCNVHSQHLEEPARSVCERCSYSGSDTYFFDRVTNQTNEFFLGMKSVIQNFALSIPFLILDNADMTDFFLSIEFHATMALKRGKYMADNETFHFPPGRSNSQEGVSERLCDFGMPGTMMKQHATSLEVYRWITQGRYGGDGDGDHENHRHDDGKT